MDLFVELEPSPKNLKISKTRNLRLKLIPRDGIKIAKIELG